MKPDKSELLKKYNTPGPRYTSYPTVPYWDERSFDRERWPSLFRTALSENGRTGISLYIHLPYCESLCTYCGCNTRITVNHAVEKPYVNAVLKEFALYKAVCDTSLLIRELHLGGGTPTFFSPGNLEKLILGITKHSGFSEDADLSFEGHPNNTTNDHLKSLFDLGFRRVSFGVQDLDPVVQKAINRIQPFENLERVSLAARKTGYTSLNFDLVYGLPFQTPDGLIRTVEKVIGLRPDRIAFYSYAHVPWKHPGQRRYTEKDLPEGEEKRMLYEAGRELLLLAGYEEIGMDHFALPGDPLLKASRDGTMHRNFMGYTPWYTKVLLGLGVSAISDIGSAFGQNEKAVEKYLEKLDQERLPLLKGHILTREDKEVRKAILDLICRSEAEIPRECLQSGPAMHHLAELEADRLITRNEKIIQVTETGKPFIRNVCMAFDLCLNREKKSEELFSKTI